MAAAVMGRTEVNLREIGDTVNIPGDPRAKLMYYLDCICVLLDLSDQSNLAKLRKYRQYYSLSEEELDVLVSLCFLLSPDTLSGKVMFNDPDMCGDISNQFYELSAVRTNLLISESLMIGGQQRAVKMIMFFKPVWLQVNWVIPMQTYAERIARIEQGRPPPRPAVTYTPRPAITYNEQRSTPTYNRPGYSGNTYQPRRNSSGNNRKIPCCTIL